MAAKQRPLWKCPKCGERFVTRNMWHSCGRYSLQALFAGSEPRVFRMFQKFAAMVRRCGPVRMIPQKTRVVFQVRVRYAGAIPHKSHLMCGFALAKRHDDPRITKIVSYSPYFHGHHMRIDSAKQLDAQVQRWLREAYGVGAQRQRRERRK
jgi:hypothetical protein